MWRGRKQGRGVVNGEAYASQSRWVKTGTSWHSQNRMVCRAAADGANRIHKEESERCGGKDPRGTADDLEGFAHEILRLGVGGIAGLPAEVEFEEAVILRRYGKGFAGEMLALLHRQIIEGCARR